HYLQTLIADSAQDGMNVAGELGFGEAKFHGHLRWFGASRTLKSAARLRDTSPVFTGGGQEYHLLHRHVHSHVGIAEIAKAIFRAFGPLLVDQHFNSLETLAPSRKQAWRITP